MILIEMKLTGTARLKKDCFLLASVKENTVGIFVKCVISLLESVLIETPSPPFIKLPCS